MAGADAPVKRGSCAAAEHPRRCAEADEAATKGQHRQQQHLLPPWFQRRGKVIMVGPAALTVCFSSHAG